MSLDMPMQAASRYMTDKGADLQGAKRRERQTGVALQPASTLLLDLLRAA